MKVTVLFKNQLRQIDFLKPLHISLPVQFEERGVNAFYLDEPVFAPFRAGNFVGSVTEGGACNCEVITLSPHGNGTHTECIGHISRERITIHDSLKEYNFFARLITVVPESINDDNIITKEILVKAFKNNPLLKESTALIIRTNPNELLKTSRKYSGTNPIYIEPKAMAEIVALGVEHLLVDFPSVDREEDSGLLKSHHIFWQYPAAPRMQATITELIYVPDEIPDGDYFLQMQIAPLESDASPSKPVLYEIV
ncbi:MAG: cyclase family protein [Bacteroidota bacterium]